jgi:hypothetical protein
VAPPKPVESKFYGLFTYWETGFPNYEQKHPFLVIDNDYNYEGIIIISAAIEIGRYHEQKS